MGPVFKQRIFGNTFHGYAIQDFLDVDPRFGTRQDLVKLVSEAHAEGLRVILDVIFNHSGCNWNYGNGQRTPAYKPFPGFYEKGPWFDSDENPIATLGPGDADAGVWPVELQQDDYYTRAGTGNLGAGNIDDPNAEFRRTDFIELRDINFDGTQALDDLARCYKYWIALATATGFVSIRSSTSQETGRSFCGTIRNSPQISAKPISSSWPRLRDPIATRRGTGRFSGET